MAAMLKATAHSTIKSMAERPNGKQTICHEDAVAAEAVGFPRRCAHVIEMQRRLRIKSRRRRRGGVEPRDHHDTAMLSYIVRSPAWFRRGYSQNRPAGPVPAPADRPPGPRCSIPAAHNFRSFCLNPGIGQSNFLCAPGQVVCGQLTVGSSSSLEHGIAMTTSKEKSNA
jgi:hypothetical protein